MISFEKRVTIIFCFLLACVSLSFTQNESSLLKNFKNLSCPEKYWVITHPFVAKMAWKITRSTQTILETIKRDSLFDGDVAGGQVDAFRHSLWMALLCKEIHWRKALKLGIAHEKGNKIDFEKGRMEDGFMQDKTAMDMDLFNNNYGIALGKKLGKITEQQTIAIGCIKEAVLNGDLKVIKKDRKGNSLDENNAIITDWMGKWENGRILVPSNFIRMQK